jgi:hypothetical protein
VDARTHILLVESFAGNEKKTKSKIIINNRLIRFGWALVLSAFGDFFFQISRDTAKKKKQRKD